MFENDLFVSSVCCTVTRRAAISKLFYGPIKINSSNLTKERCCVFLREFMYLNTRRGLCVSVYMFDGNEQNFEE